MDSAVVQIERVPERLEGEDTAFLKRVVRAAFAMRRKTLANNLASSFGMNKAAAAEVVEESGFPALARGETLSLDDFVTLSHALKNRLATSV